MSVTNRLFYDPSTTGNYSLVGSHILSGNDGSQIGYETVNSEKWLRVGATLFDDSGAVYSAANPLPVDITDANISVTEEDVYVHGSAWGTGVDKGTFILGVDASGDYERFSIDADGDLKVHDTDVLAALGGTLDVDITAQSVGNIDVDIAAVSVAGGLDVKDIANTSIVAGATAVSTSLITAAANTANRKYLFLSNEGNKSLYLGTTGTTASTGFPLHPGMQIMLRAGASLDVKVIGETGASAEDMRYLELQ